MATALYMDVHVPWAITDQLRRRGVDVLTAHEDDTTELDDHDLLAHCRQLQRLGATYVGWAQRALSPRR